MKVYKLLQELFSVTLLLSMGVWIGVGISIYEDLSSNIRLVAFLLIPICAFGKMLIYNKDKKHKNLK